MKRFFVIALTLFMLVLPLSACGKTGNTTTVKVCEVTHSVFYAPLYYAVNAGYFTQEGIQIELTNGGGADKCMTALLSGDADVGFMGPESAIYVYEAGKSDYAQVFGQLTKRDGSFLVSRKAEPNFKWTDLAGKTVIAGRRGGVPAMTFEYVCKNNGLINGSNVNLNLDVAFNMMAGAFEGGQGDYVTLFEPTASEFEAAGKGHIVASVGAESGEIPYTCFIAKKSWLKKQEKTAEKFLRAIYRAIYDMQTKSSLEIAQKLLPSFAGTDVESLKTAVESYLAIDAWCKNMAMTESSFIRLQTVMMSAGELEEYTSYTAIANNALAEKLYAEFFPA